MFRVPTAIFAALAVSGAWAQTAPSIDSAPPALSALEVSVPATAPIATCCQVVAGTVLSLEILDTLNSSQHHKGDTFGLRVLSPLIVDGIEVIPSGTTGMGQVVHAAAARSGGAPGELLIAARSLDVNGRSVPLRGLKLGVSGGDNSGMAIGVSLAAGPFALFIRGREIEIPALTQVEAKVAHTAILPPLATAAADIPHIQEVPPTQPE